MEHWRDKEVTCDAVLIGIKDYPWDEKVGLPVDSFAGEDVVRHIYRAYPIVPSPFCNAHAMK